MTVENNNETVEPTSWSPFTSPIMCFDEFIHILMLGREVMVIQLNLTRSVPTVLKFISRCPIYLSALSVITTDFFTLFFFFHQIQTNTVRRKTNNNQ